MAAISGWSGGVTLGLGVKLPITRWQVTWQIEKIDITNAEDSPSIFGADVNTPGGRTYLPGYETFTISFDCFWDKTLNPFFQGGNDLRVSRRKGVPLTVYLVSDSTSWAFDQFFVENFTMESEIRGVVKYSVTGYQNSYPAQINWLPF